MSLYKLCGTIRVPSKKLASQSCPLMPKISSSLCEIWLHLEEKFSFKTRVHYQLRREPVSVDILTNQLGD